MDSIKPKFIEKEPSAEPAENFDLLVEQGIRLLQKLTGNEWTDYNVHDPGVTILEQLCFAFTDLSYRTGFSIEDILTNKYGEINKTDHLFFDKEKILTINPVSVNDFRKAILDDIEEIDNVHIVPLTSEYTSAYVKGLYRIFVKVSDAVAERFKTEPGLEKEITDKVRFSFLAKRNLGEDLVRQITILKPQTITIKASILVREFIQPEEILLDICRKIQNLLSPKIRFYSEKELVKQNMRVEDLYDGPLLKHGIVPDSELKPLVSEIDIFEIIRAVSEAKGVLMVHDLSLNEQKSEGFGKPFKLPVNTFPLLDVETLAEGIQLFTGEYKLHVRKKDFLDLLAKSDKMRSVERRQVLHAPQKEVINRGTFRRIGEYFSIQENFPAIYGIGKFGLSSHETEQRKAQAKQLKAYIIFFEQILANYLAQLSSVGTLFSTRFAGDTEHSYFFNTIYQAPGIKDILYPGATESDWEAFTKNDSNTYIKSLGENQENVTTYRHRKHLVFEHLYGRFNEKFSTYPVLLFIDLYEGDDPGRTGLLLRWKAEVLQAIPDMEYNRIRSFNYDEEQTDVSWFEKKMLLLLHIKNTKKRKLSEVFENGNIAFVRESDNIHFARSTHSETRHVTWAGEAMNVLHQTDDIVVPSQIGKLLAGGISQKDAYLFRKQGISVLKHGINEKNYRIGPALNNEQGYVIVYKDPAKETWHTISRHQTRQQAHEALKRLTRYLRKLSVESEGFHLVEHILLRPNVTGNTFGFRFCGKKDDVLMQNEHWTDFEQREQIIRRMISDLTKSQGHAVHDEFRLRVGDHFVRYAENKPHFITDMAAASKALSALRAEMAIYKHNRTRLYPGFEMLAKMADGKVFKEDFFNMRISVVLPSWPARFQEPEFRTYVEDLFRNSAPAYLQIHFIWLGAAKMKEFEHTYFEWIESLKNITDANPLAERLSMLLGAKEFIVGVDS
ncbi:MAG: hypothetical protein JST26_08645 [Bacteroidetes bacterium]|nr:hypothetical protein [Bacteroidota bacterium]